MKFKNSYSTFDVAKMIGVSAPTIIKWANDGKIESYRTPGGHRRILHEVFIGFCEKYKYPIFNNKVKQPQCTHDSIIVVNSDEELSATLKEFIEDNTNFMVEIADELLMIGVLLGLLKPKILLLDLSLTAIDSIQVSRKLRKIKSFNNLKIIAYTSLINSETDEVGEFDAYFLKTEPFKRLLDLIKDLDL